MCVRVFRWSKHVSSTWTRIDNRTESIDDYKTCTHERCESQFERPCWTISIGGWLCRIKRKNCFFIFEEGRESKLFYVYHSSGTYLEFHGDVVRWTVADSEAKSWCGLKTDERWLMATVGPPGPYIRSVRTVRRPIIGILHMSTVTTPPPPPPPTPKQ